MTDTQENLKGKVKSVCQEWLIREDSALAYQLQDREINEHYKGNRYRNQIVRQDFPTALSEQILEKQAAEKQAMLYQKQIEEIERNDRLYAAEVERQVKLEGRDRQIPIPPRDKPKPSVNKYLSHSPEASPNLHYACLDLAPGSRKIVLESPERRYTKISLQSHTPEKKVLPAADVPPPRPAKASHLRKNAAPASPIKNSTDGVDSIRPYSDIDTALDEALDLEMQNLDINNLYKPKQNGFNNAQYNPNIQQRHPHHQFLEDGRNILKMSAEHDQRRHERLSDEAGAAGFSGGIDAISELGLTSDEIKEFERLKQEEEDKEYALRLERELADRMFAQETQDRLLAEALFKRDKKKQQLKKKEQQQKKQLLKAQQSEMEQYSNPVDMLQGEQHQKNARSPEGGHHQKQSSFNSQSSYNSGESYPQDDSYSNPFDMVPPLRPNHLELRGPVNRPQMPRAHLPEDQNIAAMIDPTYTVPVHPSTSQNTVANATTPDILEHYEDKSTAPYMPGNMPIQGTRRNSSNEKKRKQKERCNQQ